MVSSGRGSWIRTNDPLLPKQMRYQTALYPDGAGNEIRTHDLLDGNQMLYQLSYSRMEPPVGVEPTTC